MLFTSKKIWFLLRIIFIFLLIFQIVACTKETKAQFMNRLALSMEKNNYRGMNRAFYFEPDDTFFMVFETTMRVDNPAAKFGVIDPMVEAELQKTFCKDKIVRLIVARGTNISVQYVTPNDEGLLTFLIEECS